MGVQGGRSFLFGGPRTPTWARPEKKKRLSGGPFGAPKVALEGPSAILKLLKNHWFSLHFEPLDPSDAAKVTKKRVKWGTLMQVKSRRYQENRNKKTAAPSEPKKKPRSRRENPKERPKAMPIIDRRGLKTMLLQKYGFYRVKLSFSLLPQTRFFWPRVNEWQPERDPREGPGAPRRPFRNFRGGKGAQKGPERSPRGGLEGPSGAQRWQK